MLLKGRTNGSPPASLKWLHLLVREWRPAGGLTAARSFQTGKGLVFSDEGMEPLVCGEADLKGPLVMRTPIHVMGALLLLDYAKARGLASARTDRSDNFVRPATSEVIGDSDA